jgi:DNA polymerase-3 subunit delta
MTAATIISDIKKRNFKPIYFLYGNEPYFIDQISDLIENTVLNESEKGFNQMVLYGRDVSIDEIVSNAKRFPMMAEHQVIIIKEAQHLARTIHQLETYIDQVQTTTILVFNYKYKSPDKRKTVFKKMAKIGVLFESKPLYENQVPAWISNFVKDKGYQIAPKASVMLVEFLGTELSKITNELNKLFILLPKESMITPEAIEENIGISKDFNNFELRKAIGSKNIVKANQIINYFAQNPKNNPTVMTISLLNSFFTQLLQYHALPNKSNPKAVASALRVNPFFVSDYTTAGANYPMRKVSQIIGYLRDADIKSKGVGARDLSQGDLLKELLFKIMH